MVRSFHLQSLAAKSTPAAGSNGRSALERDENGRGHRTSTVYRLVLRQDLISEYQQRAPASPAASPPTREPTPGEARPTQRPDAHLDARRYGTPWPSARAITGLRSGRPPRIPRRGRPGLRTPHRPPAGPAAGTCSSPSVQTCWRWRDPRTRRAPYPAVLGLAARGRFQPAGDPGHARRRVAGGLRIWDGSRLGPSGSDATVRVASPGAIRRLLWSPDELGLGRAYAAGDIDLDGDVFAILVAPRDVAPATSGSASGSLRRCSRPIGWLYSAHRSPRPGTRRWVRCW
jgi:hypothetical protein